MEVKRGADVGSDHHFITAKCNIKLKLMIIAPKSIIRQIDTGKLRDNKVREDFRLDIKNRFQVFQHYGDKNGEGLTSNGVISTTCSV